MTNRIYAAACIFPGLLAAEVIASIHIFLTNQWLEKKIFALISAGYLSLPNTITAPILNTLTPAIFGGLFYAFTIGAGLSVATFFFIWIWDRLFSRSRPALAVLVVIWISLIVSVNFHGFSPAAFAHTFFIPPAVFITTIKFMPAREGTPLYKRFVLHALAIFVPAVLLISTMDSGLFSDVRDQILLSNKPGIAVSNFYYKYTLYPAEAFKSLQQKSQKTVYLEDMEGKPFSEKFETTLRHRDYLRIKDIDASDLIIEKENKRFLFREGKAVILEVAATDFFADPDSSLKLFSDRIDRNNGLRRLTFYTLLTGFPLLLYLILFTMTAALFDFFLTTNRADTAAVCLCLVTALAVLFILYQAKTSRMKVNDIKHALLSVKAMKRAAAYKKISMDNLEVASFKGYETAISSPCVPERYWLAKSLGNSKTPATYPVLAGLLNDPNPNVVCQALWSLGNRNKRSAIVMISQKLNTSSHWYVQWYAYRALRTLGWVQKKST